jgi:tryptophan synthase beta chain
MSASAAEGGQFQFPHSVSAALNSAAIGPEHGYLRDLGHTEYDFATDDEELAVLQKAVHSGGSSRHSSLLTPSPECS